jgi:hypothetical protein
MPLRGEEDEGRDNGPVSSGLLPAPDPLPSVAAPWADWADRKVSCSGPGLLPSLAFLGWLNGYTIGYQSLSDGRAVYGVGDLVHGHACWLGLREWRVTGTAGRNLGTLLWRDFLDRGGPWPTEFRLRAAPLDTPDTEDGGAGEGVFVRQGSRCRQVWTLGVRRERPAWN